MTYTADLIGVGSGILGLATAWRATAQNFGHACFTAQDDTLQDLAAGWTAAAADAGFRATRPGTVLPAVTGAEMQVLREFHAHRGAQDVRLIDREEVRARLGNPHLACLGGAHLPRDMRVDPREAAPALAQYLAGRGVRFIWRT
ncbi:MAG: FAD-binding oxidoreductase, partial [Corynebacterium sp.]|nr:FAD-binding oxidoreductase [Corynebacterium sp.]